MVRRAAVVKWEALRYLTLANVRIGVKISCVEALPICYPLISSLYPEDCIGTGNSAFNAKTRETGPILHHATNLAGSERYFRSAIYRSLRLNAS